MNIAQFLMVTLLLPGASAGGMAVLFALAFIWSESLVERRFKEESQ